MWKLVSKCNTTVFGKCGTLRLLLFLFVLTLFCNLRFDVVSFGDYWSITYKLDGYSGACVLPVLDPFDPAMMRDYKDLTPFKCEGPPPLVYFDRDGLLKFNETFVQTSGLKLEEITCQCQELIRVDNDDWADFDEPFKCHIPFSYNKDFLKVTCHNKHEQIYDHFLFKTHKKRRFGATDKDRYSVLLFGIDTVSRSSSIRHLKKTVKYLKNDLGAFDFKGYMKTGGVTYPNLVAILSGMFPNGKGELPITDETTDFFDDKPLIWKDFAAKNYTTFYAEDLPLLNTFNLKKKGFKQPPVDHYMRPYWLGWHKISPMRDYKNGVSLDLLNVNMLKSSLEQYLCTGGITNYAAHLGYLKQFLATYKNERKFGLSFLVEIGHNNQNILNLADKDIHLFLQWMKNEGHLDDTILVVFSDHGPKTGHTFYTARMEKSLPMLYIVLPNTLKQTYPEITKHLAENTKKLTTHFDLHATLRDILERRYSSPTKFIHKSVVRGISLFGPVPSNRSCAEAFVNEHFCVCYKSHSVPVEGNPTVQELGRAIVKKINSMLLPKTDCAQLTLDKIIQAEMVSDAQTATYTHKSINVIRPKLQSDTREKYVIVVETSPSGGQFLATCIRRKGQPTEVLDEIDRVNRYNNQSYCVSETNLRPLCFCKKQG